MQLPVLLWECPADTLNSNWLFTSPDVALSLDFMYNTGSLAVTGLFSLYQKTVPSQPRPVPKLSPWDCPFFLLWYSFSEPIYSEAKPPLTVCLTFWVHLRFIFQTFLFFSIKKYPPFPEAAFPGKVAVMPRTASRGRPCLTILAPSVQLGLGA